MRMPKVTVLTAVYNAEATLPKCLDSLLGQSLADIEIIAVDDASTDGSAEVLARYAATDERLKVFRQPANGGQAKARNLALQHATGDFICMVDADDWLATDALEKTWLVSQQHADADAILFRLMLVYPDGREVAFPNLSDEREHRSLEGKEAMRLSLRWQIHGLYLIRADIHKAYPYDDSARLYSDDNTTRLHYLHSRRVYFSDGIYYYFQNPASTTQRVSALYFESLRAQRHMRDMLHDEGIADDIIADYEQYRWMQLVDNCYYLALHHDAFTPDERRSARQLIDDTYHSFPTTLPTPPKFGYRRMHSFRAFWLQEQLYFTLRRLTGRMKKNEK